MGLRIFKTFLVTYVKQHATGEEVHRMGYDVRAST